MAGYTGTNNPLLVTYHQLAFSRLPAVSYFCQTVKLPGLGVGSVEQPTPFGLPINIPSGAIRFEELEIKFKVDENLKNWLELYNWIRGNGNLGDCDEQPLPRNLKTDSSGILLITNSSYKPKFKVSFKNLWPTAVSGIEFSTALPESMEVIATASFMYTTHKVEVV